MAVLTLNLMPVVLDQERINNLLITEFEQGLFWGMAKQVNKDAVFDKNDLRKHTWYADEAGKFCYAFSDENNRPFVVGEEVCGVIDGEELKGKYRHLTLESLAEGLSLYYTLALRGKLALVSYEEFDASDVDTVVQLAVFGAWVYG